MSSVSGSTCRGRRKGDYSGRRSVLFRDLDCFQLQDGSVALAKSSRIAAVMNALAGWRHERERVLFILCATAGLRIGEARGIGDRQALLAGLSHDHRQSKSAPVQGRRASEDRECSSRNRHSPRDCCSSPSLHCGPATRGSFSYKEREAAMHLKHSSAASAPCAEGGWLSEPSTGDNKAGSHAFRRFRNTYLCNRTTCPESVRKFWLGHAGQNMSDLYDKIKEDVPFRRECAERPGIGFDLPSAIPNVPKGEDSSCSEEVA